MLLCDQCPPRGAQVEVALAAPAATPFFSWLGGSSASPRAILLDFVSLDADIAHDRAETVSASSSESVLVLGEYLFLLFSDGSFRIKSLLAAQGFLYSAPLLPNNSKAEIARGFRNGSLRIGRVQLNSDNTLLVAVLGQLDGNFVVLDITLSASKSPIVVSRA